MNKIYWWTTIKKRSNLDDLLFWLNKKINFSFTISNEMYAYTIYVSKENKFEVGGNWIQLSSGSYDYSINKFTNDTCLINNGPIFLQSRLDPNNTFTFNIITDEEFNKYEIK